MRAMDVSASGLLVCSRTSHRRLTPPALDLSASGLRCGGSDWSTPTKHTVLRACRKPRFLKKSVSVQPAVFYPLLSFC